VSSFTILDPIVFDTTQANRELCSFKTWISSRPYFSGKEAFSEIRVRPQMACLLAYVLIMRSTDFFKLEINSKSCVVLT